MTTEPKWITKFIEEFERDDPDDPNQGNVFEDAEVIIAFIQEEVIKPFSEKVQREVGVHESPHILHNCTLCRVQNLTSKWL